MYVYSIGATLSVALESTVGSHLYQLLAAMMSSEPSKRPSLQSVVDTASAQQSAQGAAHEIYTLVTFVLDAEQHVSVPTICYNRLVQSVLLGIIW